MHTAAPFVTISCSSSSRASMFFTPILKFTISTPNPIISPIFASLQAISHGMQDRTSVVYSRKRRRRTGFQRSAKLMLELASIVASNLKILPPPLDLVIAELSGGDGSGGGGLWRRSGGGGFYGWGRKRTNPSLFIGFLLICGVALLFLTELEFDLVCGILGFGLFSVALIQLWRKRGLTGDFICGFSLFGVLVALGLRRFEMQKWMRKIQIRSPRMMIGRRKIKGRKVF